MANQPTTPLTAAQVDKAVFVLASRTYGDSLSALSKSLPVEAAHVLGLTKDRLAKLMLVIKKKQAVRRNNRPESAEQLRGALRRQLSQAILAKNTARLEAGFAYRQPSSDWVMVKNRVRVLLGGPSMLTVRTTTQWHPKKKWKANETDHILHLSPLDDFTTSGGLVTILRKADRNQPAIPCRWYEQSRGFEVREVVGYLVGDYHVEADSPAAALALVQRRNKQAAKARQAQAALSEGRDSAPLSAALVHRVFGFCKPGIVGFCEANNLNPKQTYTLREVRAAVVANRELNCRVYASYLYTLGIKLNCN